MAKNSSTSNFKKWPAAFLMALSMVLVFEFLNSFFDDYLYEAPYDGLRIKAKNELAHKPGNNFDYLILGDCYPHIGLIPKIIDDKTSLHGFNFGTHVAYSIFSSYCFFKSYLKTCARKPKYVIISYLPASLALEKKDIEKDDWALFYDFNEHNQIPLFEEFGPRSLSLMLPSLKHQYFFQDPAKLIPSLKSRLANAAGVRPFIDDMLDKQGHDPFIEDNIYLIFNWEKVDPFHVSPFFDKYLRNMLKLSRQNHIRVIYLVPTSPAKVYEKAKSLGNVDAYARYLEGIKKEFPDMTIMSPQDDLDEMFSYSGELHLNFWGASRLSDLAGEKMAELQKS